MAIPTTARPSPTTVTHRTSLTSFVGRRITFIWPLTRSQTASPARRPD